MEMQGDSTLRPDAAYLSGESRPLKNFCHDVSSALARSLPTKATPSTDVQVTFITWKSEDQARLEELRAVAPTFVARGYKTAYHQLPDNDALEDLQEYFYKWRGQDRFSLKIVFYSGHARTSPTGQFFLW